LLLRFSPVSQPKLDSGGVKTIIEEAGFMRKNMVGVIPLPSDFSCPRTEFLTTKDLEKKVRIFSPPTSQTRRRVQHYKNSY
jgi:hypothetical protein